MTLTDGSPAAEQKLLQQIVASDSASLTFTELEYRNPSQDTDEIHAVLQNLINQRLVTEIPIDAPSRYPQSVYAVTSIGRRWMESRSLYEGCSLFYQLYRQMDRTERIKEIEQLEHPTCL